MVELYLTAIFIQRSAAIACRFTLAPYFYSLHSLGEGVLEYKMTALWTFLVSQTQEMILPHYLSVALAISSAAGAAARCRCLYGQTCWPNEAAFSSLSSNVSQPLIHPVPPASACYPASSPSGNCSDVVTHYRDAGWRADLPGALQNPNFETFTFKNGSIDACYLNVTLGLPCGQGSVPPIGVDARTVEDVQAAVVFAKQHNLRLIVKNTGHDYLGRSAGRGGFLLWTHHLKNLSYDEAFVPQGAGSDSNKTFSGQLSNLVVFDSKANNVH